MSYADDIASFLKIKDKHRYYSTLIIDNKYRSDVQALYAFNAEISAISLRVNEQASGEIRLKFFSDLLEGEGRGDILSNPIASAFLFVVKKYNLAITPLIRLIEARRFDLYSDVMPDIKSFEGYAGETASLLYQYSAMIINNGEPIDNGDAAGHLGVAHALIGHILSLGFNASRGRVFLPFEVFKAHGVSEQQLFEGKASEQLGAAIDSFCEMADEHLSKARLAIKTVPKNTRPAFAYISVLDKQLNILKRNSNSATLLTQSPHSLSNMKIMMHLVLWTMSKK